MKLSHLGITGFAALVLACGVFISHRVDAANTFVVRGIADVKLTKSAIYITPTYASPANVREDILNENTGFSLSGATKYYKYVNKKKVLTSWNSVRLGQEVVVKGTTSGGSYKVTELTINDRTFSITGTVNDVNEDTNMIKVTVKTSTYKQPNIKNKNIPMYYSSRTKCVESGKEIGCSEILSEGQKIKVEGGVTGVHNKYELLNVWNNY